MHCAGWVHRDISCGNILAYKPGGDRQSRWHAKLSDLEYAKQFPPSENDPDAWDKDPKTGTPYFMPHEILLGEYLSLPTVTLTAEEMLARQNKKQEIIRQLRGAKDEVEDDEHGNEKQGNKEEQYREWEWEQKKKEKMELEEREKMKDNTGHGPTQVAVENPFRVVHNPQHDIESLWWLALWTLTLRVNHTSSSRKWAFSIFQHTLVPSTQRRDAFNFDIEHNLFKYLHKDLREPFAMAIGNFRALLHFSYRVREQKDLVLELTTYAQAYGYADNFFKKIHADRESARKWRAMKLEQDQADIPKAKRPRSVSNPEVDEASGSKQPNAESSASAGQRSLKRPKV
ncbi:hypothetical protein CPC08DRAFT_498864 [Agrocybe pediades]|nr:hypothetical protein CPC08DRAFT_498864 [Agrocybe pediades]